MATSIAALLDATASAAATATAADRATAAITLGHLGRALAALREDGIARTPGDLRELQIAQLAVSCRELAVTAPYLAREPRLAMLGGALADAAILAGHAGVIEQRWAITAALTGLVEPLTTLIVTPGSGDLPSERARQIQRHARRAWQTICQIPPTVEHNTVLDTPVPALVLASESAAQPPGQRLIEAMALLVHCTSRDHDPLTIAEMLATATAAHTLASTAAETLTGPAAHDAAAACWAAVRESLRPFADGSRRPHHHRPPRMDAALTIHRIASDPATRVLTAELADVAQHLPALADNVVRSVTADQRFVALASDLPFREERLASVLAGSRPEGVVCVDTRDLIPVTTALAAARLTSTTLACDLGDNRTPQASHVHAAHLAFRAQPDAAEQIRDAQLNTLRQLQEQPRSHPLPQPLIAVLRRATEAGHDVRIQLAGLRAEPVSAAQAQSVMYSVMDAHPDTIPRTPTVSSSVTPPAAYRGRTRAATEAASQQHQSPGHSPAPGR